MLMLVAALVVQTVPSATPEPGTPLSSLPAPCPAGPTVTGDVIVCAHRRDSDRLGVVVPPPGTDTPADPLSLRLPGGGTGRVHAFRRDLPGATSQGVAATFTFPLGRKR